MSGWAGAAQGFASGLDKGLSIGNAFQQREMQEKKFALEEQQQKLQTYQKFIETMDFAKTNPGMGEPVLMDIMKNMNLDTEKQKMYLGVIRNSRLEDLADLKEVLSDYGLDPTAMPLDKLLRFKPNELHTWAKDRREQMLLRQQRGIIQQELGEPPAGAPGMPPGAPPTALSPPQPGVGAPPATAEPSLSATQARAAPVAGPPGVPPPVAPMGAAPPFRGAPPPEVTTTPLPPATEPRRGLISRGLPTTGIVDQGNINIDKRPVVKNPDGSISTERSMSFNEDGKEVLIPTISPDGKEMTPDQAIAHYRKTGEHLGKFDSVENAEAYGRALSQRQAGVYGDAKRVPRADPEAVPRGGGGGGIPATGGPAPRAGATPALSPDETRNKELYQRQLSAARRLQGLGPEAAKSAKEYADAADETAKRAWRQATPQELSRIGALPGAVGKYNPILDITEVTTQGQQTVSTSNPELAKQLLGAAYKPGDVLEITRGSGGQITGIKQLREGVDQLIRVDPGAPEVKKLNLNPDALVYRNPRSGELMVKEKGTDQIKLLTAEQIEKETGVKVSPGIYGRTKSGDLKEVAKSPDEYTTLSQAEKKEQNLDPKKDWKMNKKTKEVFQLGSQTEADPSSKERAKQDIEQLGERRKMGGAASEARAKASNIRELLKTARPGLFANERAWLGGLVQELTGKAPSGTASLEALRGQLEEGALGKSGQLSGSIQVKELDFIRRAGPALFNTKEGNEILVDLMDESARRQEEIADLAEEWTADGKDLSERHEKYGGKNFYQMEREIKRQDLPESIRSRINQEIDLKNAANMDFTKVSPERAAELAGNTRFINSLSDARKAQLLKALGYEGKLPGQPGYVNPYGAR